MILRRMLVLGALLALPVQAQSAPQSPPLTDVLRGARGFSLKSQILAEARPVSQGIGNAPCSSKDSLPARGLKSKRIVVYLDGLRLGTGLEGLNDAVAANQILAMETYPDVMSARFGGGRTMPAP